MRIGRSRLVVVVMVLLLMPATASAHIHIADFFGAFSYGDASKLFGPHMSLGITWPPWLEKDLSWVGDFSVHIGTHDERDLTRVTSLGGLRYEPKGIVSIQVLGGVVHDARESGVTKPALALGAGWEYPPERKDGTGFAFRAQVDYVFVYKGGEGFARYSAGVAYRIQ